MTDFLKHRYNFSDFLYYIMLLAIPLVTAIVAMLEQSGPGTVVVFLVVAGACIPIMLRFFCTHCPHYCRDEKSLKCIFFWGLPKFFEPRPGPLSILEKALSVTAPALLLLYPVYWLIQTPGLLIIYLLSVIGFGATVRRNECPRCIYTDCPANTAGRNPHLE